MEADAPVANVYIPQEAIMINERTVLAAFLLPKMERQALMMPYIMPR